MKQLIKTISILFLFGVVACTGKKTNTDQPHQTAGDTTIHLKETDQTQTIEQYVNLSYGYILYYPSYLTPQGESDNSDGQVFRSSDGINLSVWGNKNTLSFSNSPEEEFAFRKQCYVDDKSEITYEKRIKDTYILSGINPNGKIFYQKMVFNKNKDIFYMLLLEYPDNYRKKGDEIIKTSISPFPKRQDGSDVEPELEENTEQQL